MKNEPDTKNTDWSLNQKIVRKNDQTSLVRNALQVSLNNNEVWREVSFSGYGNWTWKKAKKHINTISRCDELKIVPYHGKRNTRSHLILWARDFANIFLPSDKRTFFCSNFGRGKKKAKRKTKLRRGTKKAKSKTEEEIEFSRLISTLYLSNHIHGRSYISII